MNDIDERIDGFVRHLCRLASDKNPDRGALADLRSGLSLPPGQAHKMHKHIVPYLGERDGRSDKWFYVVGALFGLHRSHRPKVSLAKAFRKLAREGSHSIEKRFLALLQSHPNDLHKHLGAAAGLLKSKDIAFDYAELLHDLTRWSDPEKLVQNRWARDFYRSSKQTENTENEENVHVSQRED